MDTNFIKNSTIQSFVKKDLYMVIVHRALSIYRVNRNLSEKKRRDQFNMLVNELCSMVSTSSKKMDKSTVLKSTIAYLKTYQGKLITAYLKHTKVDQTQHTLKHIKVRLIIANLKKHAKQIKCSIHKTFQGKSTIAYQKTYQRRLIIENLKSYRGMSF